jgi:hypothetical protein
VRQALPFVRRNDARATYPLPRSDVILEEPKLARHPPIPGSAAMNALFFFKPDDSWTANTPDNFSGNP